MGYNYEDKIKILNYAKKHGVKDTLEALSLSEFNFNHLLPKPILGKMDTKKLTSKTSNMVPLYPTNFN